MRNVRMAEVAAVALAFFGGQIRGLAQKKPLDHDVYDSWQSVSGLAVSDDGSAMVWAVNPQEGDGTLFVRKQINLDKRKKVVKETSLPRGYQPTLSPDGRWLVCRIKPGFAKTRQERIDKKKKDEMSKDTLAVVDLNTMEIKRFPSVDSYSAGRLGMPFIAYKSSWKDAPKTGAVNSRGVSRSGIILLTPGTW